MPGERRIEWRLVVLAVGSAPVHRARSLVRLHARRNSDWDVAQWSLVAEGFPVLPEWFCFDCHRWVNGLCCPGCLKIDPANVRWASQAEIEAARKRVLSGR